jgi:hypothetical protein
MARRRKVEVRSAQEFRRDAGRLNAIKGAAMRDAKALAAAPKAKPGKRAQSMPARPAGGIRMGE